MRGFEGGIDRLVLMHLNRADLTVAESGRHVRIDYGTGDILLTDAAGTVSEDDFVFL